MRFFKTVLILVFLFSFLTAQAFAAARFSGKILSFNPQSRIYVIQMKDGSKVNIKLREDGKSLRSYGNDNFKIGEDAVFSIVSALNDNPLIAESVMDSAYANQTYSTAYRMPRNTTVGTTQTLAGPVVLAGGAKAPNVIGPLANTGSIPSSENIINAPFSASPAALNSPVTGQVLTNLSSTRPPSSHENFQQSAMSPLNPQGESGFFNQQDQIPQGQNLNLIVGNTPSGAANANPNALITGNSYQNNPQTLIYGDGSYGKNGGNVHGDPSMMFGSSDEENDEDDDPFALGGGGQNVAGSSVQMTVKLMSIDAKNGVLFYMVPGAPGMQDLGTAVVTAQTRINDARTGQTITLQNLINGSNINITGIRRDASSVTATVVTVMP